MPTTAKKAAADYRKAQQDMVKRLNNDPQEAKAFLVRVGILESDGRLTKRYR